MPVILLAGARTSWIRSQSWDRYVDLRFGSGSDLGRRGQPSGGEIPHQGAEPVDLPFRLYAAAKLVGDWNDPRINLVQLVSFGCGVGAITTDEVRRILEEKNRIYTQIKIDEITQLGRGKNPAAQPVCRPGTGEGGDSVRQETERVEFTQK